MIPGTYLVIYVCCRPWICLYPSPVGRCGYCGKHPIISKDH